MHLHVASVIEALLRQHQLPCAPLQQLTAGFTPQTLLSAAQADQLYSCAVELYQAERERRNAHLGIELGQRLELVSLGMFGYALMTSATVGELLNLLLRYVRAILPSVQLNSERQAGNLRLQVEAAHLPARLRDFYIDVLFSAVQHNLMVLAPQAAQGLAVELPYAADAEIATTFAGRVSFDQASAALSVDSAVLTIAIDSSDSVAQSVFRRHCDRIIAHDSHAGLVSEQVKHQLMRCRSHFPNCAEVARQLNLSESTLRRKLAQEGSRFQPLLDQVRYRLALEYLQQTDLPVAEIALLLDFDNATNFRRALRRWCGKTPRQLRNQSA